MALKLCTVGEMRAWEQVAVARGTTVPALMERAGTAIAQVVLDDPLCHDPIVILAGPGNNGGDALIAARHLHAQGRDVRLLLWRRAATATPAPPDGVPVCTADSSDLAELETWLGQAGSIIDGLLGTGNSRPAEGELKAILEALARRRAAPSPPRVVAVDLPSGSNADTGQADAMAVQADETVALGCVKAGTPVYPAAALAGQQ